MKPRKAQKASRDVNVNAHRIFEEDVRPSEEPPKRGKIRRVPPIKNTPK
jgi:hypothetical protein